MTKFNGVSKLDRDWHHTLGHEKCHFL